MTKTLILTTDFSDFTVPIYTPEELAGLPSEQILTEEVFERIKQTVIDPRVKTEAGYALLIFNALSIQLSNNSELDQSADLKRAYQQMLAYLVAVTLPYQSPQSQQNLFSRNLLFLLRQDIDLREQITQNFAHTNNLLKENVVITDKLLFTLKQNEELLGKQQITINDKTVAPTIANWLKDFENFSPNETAKGNIDEANYLNTSKNVQTLPNVYKEMLAEIVRLYDLLRYPHSEKGLVSDLPTKKRPVAVTETSRPVIGTPLAPPTAIPAPPPMPPVKQPVAEPISQVDEDAVVEAENSLLTETEGDVTKLRAKLFDAITNNDRDSILAGLLLLARLSDLKKVLLEDKKVAAIYEKNVVPELAKSLGVQPNKFTSSYSPAHLREFLRYILERAIDDNQKAAAYGVQIEEVMQSTGSKDYAHMVYFDNKTSSYRWAEAQIDQHDKLQ